MAAFKIAIVVALMCIVAALDVASAALTCGNVAGDLSPCIAYAKTAGGKPPAPCCAGIQKLYKQAATTPDRQQTCTCLKQLATQIPGINFKTVAQTPGMCGVSVPYKISPSTNCATVK